MLLTIDIGNTNITMGVRGRGSARNVPHDDEKTENVR